MRLLLLILVLIASQLVFAQETEPTVEPPKQESPSDLSPAEFYPAMHPAARDEQRAAAAAAATHGVTPVIEAASSPQNYDVGRDWTTIEIMLTAGILLFTLIVLGMVVFLARKAQKPWSPQSILRVFGITLIIPLGVMLVAAGYSEKQIGSVVGLLGVIAGYLLGNAERTRDNA